MSINDILESEAGFQGLLIGTALALVSMLVGVIIGVRRRQAGYKNKPIETKRAKVVTRRYLTGLGQTIGSVVLFEFEDGSRHELTLDPNAAATIAGNDEGSLTYQGTKFIKFERKKNEE